MSFFTKLSNLFKRKPVDKINVTSGTKGRYLWSRPSLGKESFSIFGDKATKENPNNSFYNFNLGLGAEIEYKLSSLSQSNLLKDISGGVEIYANTDSTIEILPSVKYRWGDNFLHSLAIKAGFDWTWNPFEAKNTDKLELGDNHQIEGDRFFKALEYNNGMKSDLQNKISDVFEGSKYDAKEGLIVLKDSVTLKDVKALPQETWELGFGDSKPDRFLEEINNQERVTIENKSQETTAKSKLDQVKNYFNDEANFSDIKEKVEAKKDDTNWEFHGIFKDSLNEAKIGFKNVNQVIGQIEAFNQNTQKLDRLINFFQIEIEPESNTSQTTKSSSNSSKKKNEVKGSYLKIKGEKDDENKFILIANSDSDAKAGLEIINHLVLNADTDFKKEVNEIIKKNGNLQNRRLALVALNKGNKALQFLGALEIKIRAYEIDKNLSILVRVGIDSRFNPHLVPEINFYRA